MFLLISFYDEYDQKAYELSTIILDYAVNIRLDFLSQNKKIVWIGEDSFKKNIDEFIFLTRMDGIKSVAILPISISIHDNDWMWDEDSLEFLFRPCLRY